MTKWTIYDRKGKALHESITEFNGDGKIVYQDSLEYSGKWMGERFLTVSIKSAYPIDFQIGDYIEYRGEKFTINYDPTVIKKARRGTYGEGFTYDSIKFNSPSNELTQMRFHDWVLSDNKLHYTSLPTFTFYAKDVDDLVDRLQACADRWCKDNGYAKEDYWMFYTLRNNTVTGTADPRQTQTTYQRTLSRAKDVLESCGISETDTEGRAYLADVQSKWEKMYGIGDNYTDSRDDERYDRNISVSNQSVWDGMSMIKQQFGLNFIVRGRNVYIGAAGIPTTHLFKYGKGNGLYEVDRTADQDQAVVTKLHAYGSGDNLPTRYYADLNTEAYATITNLIRTYNKDYKTLVCEFNIDVLFSPRYFTEKIQNDDTGELYNVGLKFDSYVASQSQTNVRADDNGALVQAFFIDNDATEGQVSQLLVNIKGNIRQGKTVTFTYGVKKDAWPVDHLIASTQNLPDNMAVNFLMLPGFPNNSLADICRAEYDEKNDVTNYYITNPSTKTETLFHTESGSHLIKFSSDKYDPYIVSPNAETLGIKDFDISCTEENDDNGLEKVYPTIEEITDATAGIGSTGNRLDEIYKADKVEDNGVFPKSTTQEEKIPGFHVWLPNLGFDLRQAAKDAGGSEIQISMKDGFCGGRTFSVTNVSQEKDGTWNLDCKRTPDNDLDLYFPYSYAKSVSGVDESMTNAYQICKGDHYVLTGISVSDVNYVWAASVKLLRKAIHWLCKNDYTRYVYQPKIDEIYMAREAVVAEKLGNTSLHDALMEGDILLFSDDDLKIDGKVYIDQLNIKENGNNGIPTYDVTLRNEVQVGSLQRLQNQVDSIATDVKKGNVGGGLTSPSQVASLIEAYGEEWFVSKTKDDTANGFLIFVKGFVSKAKAKFEDAVEILKNLTVGGDASVGGNAKVSGDASVKGNSTTDGNASVGGSLTTDDIHSKQYSDNIDQASGLGYHIWMNGTTSNMVLDNLSVRGKWTASVLEVMKLQYSAGNITIDGAGGEIFSVVPYDANGNKFDETANTNLLAYSVIRKVWWRSNNNGGWNFDSITDAPVPDACLTVKVFKYNSGIYTYSILPIKGAASDKLTLSVWVKADKECTIRRIVEHGPQINHNITTEWQRITETFDSNVDGALTLYSAKDNDEPVNIYFSGFKIEEGEAATAYVPNIVESAFFRCYFKATDGDKHIENLWHIGDQARCQTFNLTDGTYKNAANRSYFRVVKNVSSEVEHINGVDCWYIDLSNLQNDTLIADTVVGDTKVGDTIYYRGIMHDKAKDGTVTWASNDVPMKGDQVAHVGNVYDTERQGAVQLIAVGETKGLVIYDGINETLSNLSSFAKMQLSPKNSFINTRFITFTNGYHENTPYIQCGDWVSGTTAHASEVWQYDGSSWICNEETTAEPSEENDAWTVMAKQGKQGIQGVPGNDGTSVTVKSTDVTYAVSTQGTDASKVTGWKNTIPQTDDTNAFLWTRSIVSYSDGTTSNPSYSVSYKGKDGKGIEGTPVTKYYNAGQNGAAQPTDDKFTSTSFPTGVKQGDYVWSLTATTYTDGNSTKSYACNRIGADGSKGMNVHIAYATDDKGTAFSTTWFSGATWIGICESTATDDPGKYTDYKWNKIKGDDGKSVTVTSYSVSYQLSNSGTTIPTGTWQSTVQQPTDAQPYLWTRTVVNYSDGTPTTSYSVSSKGKDGTTPSVSISTNGYWVINGKETTDKAIGDDGHNPYVGTDGYWYTWDDKQGKFVSTNIKAKGDKGDSVTIKSTETAYHISSNGTTPPSDNNWTVYKSGVSIPQTTDSNPYLWTRVTVTYNQGNPVVSYSVSYKGKDGHSPSVTISTDGYWIIDGTKTNTKAQGNDGHTPTITISSDGYWIVDGNKTTTKAKGEDGMDGTGVNPNLFVFKGASTWNNQGGSHSFAPIEDAPNKYSNTIVRIKANRENSGLAFLAKYDANKIYTLSLWIKADSPTIISNLLNGDSGVPTHNITTEWQRITETTIEKHWRDYINLQFYISNSDIDITLYICGIKIEEGDTATAYIPNEADLKGDQGDAATSYYINPEAVLITERVNGITFNNDDTYTAKDYTYDIDHTIAIHKTVGNVDTIVKADSISVIEGGKLGLDTNKLQASYKDGTGYQLSSAITSSGLESDTTINKIVVQFGVGTTKLLCPIYINRLGTVTTQTVGDATQTVRTKVEADVKPSIDAAQKAANNASDAAQKAQSTANSASTAASNAQSAANKAQSTADNANTAASKAQGTADSAQKTASANKTTLDTYTAKTDDNAKELTIQRTRLERYEYDYRNLLVGSDLSDVSKIGGQILANNTETVTNIAEVSEDVRFGGQRSLHVKAMASDLYVGIYFRPIKIKRDTQYHASLWAKGSGKIGIKMIYQTAPSADGSTRDNRVHDVSYFDLTDDWTRYDYDFSTDDKHDWIECNFWCNDANTECYLSNFMLEEGDACTGWTPNVNDTAAEYRLSSEIKQNAQQISLNVTEVDNVKEGLTETGIDIEQGKIEAKTGRFDFLGKNGKPYIRVEEDEQGMPHFIFYNKAGTAMYDLGYTGMFDLIQGSDKQSWIKYLGIIAGGSKASCETLAGSYALVKGEIADTGAIYRTYYEYHSAKFVDGSGETKYYHQSENYNLYTNNSVDSTDNNAPTGTMVFSDHVGAGYLYEPYDVVDNSNGISRSEIFTFYAHGILFDKVNDDNGRYNSGAKKVEVEKSAVSIKSENGTITDISVSYRWRIDGGDWNASDTITIS